MEFRIVIMEAYGSLAIFTGARNILIYWKAGSRIAKKSQGRIISDTEAHQIQIFHEILHIQKFFTGKICDDRILAKLTNGNRNVRSSPLVK
jgi:hypothetical protein